jgi:hypothetical protein
MATRQAPFQVSFSRTTISTCDGLAAGVMETRSSPGQSARARRTPREGSRPASREVAPHADHGWQHPGSRRATPLLVTQIVERLQS